MNNILYIGNNSSDTDDMCRRGAAENNLEYKGLILNPLSIGDGAYHASIADVGVNTMYDLIKRFNRVEFLNQPMVDEADYLTATLRNQTNLSDTNLKTTDDLLFVGCSHTYGTGHPDGSTTYPFLLSEMLGVTPNIIGNPGKGNMLFEEILSKYSLQNRHVIVQFSDIYRIRTWDKNTGKVVDKMGNQFSRSDVERYTDELLIYEFFNIVDRVVSRLRDANAKFLFLFISQGFEQYVTVNYELSKYKEFCWLPDINLDLAEDGLHYGPKSHRLMAERLHTRWNKLYEK